jgi:LuxR family maltose regulon positive regulatory protein
VKIVCEKDQDALHLQKERETFTLARLRVAEGKTNEALDLIREWQHDAAQNGRVRSLVEGYCVEALAYYAGADLSAAAQPLNQALSLGHAKGFRRLFLDEGSRMATLLQAALPTLSNRTLNLYTTTLLHSFSAQEISQLPAADATIQIEPLSQQELRVLRLLVAGLSNADIARELVVSTNTIKTHVKSIYRKLTVNSREEAREVARELRLV